MSRLLTVADVVAAQARLQPDKIGARDSRRALTFAQWNERASRLANALLGSGLAQGRPRRAARVQLRRVDGDLRGARARRPRRGADQLPPRRRRDRLHRAALRGARVHRAGRPRRSGRTDPRPSSASSPAASSTSARERAPAGWQSYEALIARGVADARPTSRVAPEDTWALMYTSGTTGRPKGAIRNHAGSALMSLVTALDMGFTARRHRAARDADVPRELAVLLVHVHLSRRDLRHRRPQELRSRGAAARRCPSSR